MAFSLPVFNLTVHINRHSRGTTGGPDVVALGNLAWGRRVSSPAGNSIGGFGAAFVAPVLLLPPGTDIRDEFSTGSFDYVEVPAGTGRWYQVVVADDIGKGFANEHRAAMIIKVQPWPVPTP